MTAIFGLLTLSRLMISHSLIREYKILYNVKSAFQRGTVQFLMTLLMQLMPRRNSLFSKMIT